MAQAMGGLMPASQRKPCTDSSSAGGTRTRQSSARRSAPMADPMRQEPELPRKQGDPQVVRYSESGSAEISDRKELGQALAGHPKSPCLFFLCRIRRDAAARAGGQIARVRSPSIAGRRGEWRRHGGVGVAGRAGRGAKGVLVSVPSTAVFGRSRPRDRCERTAPTEVPMLCAASA